MLFKGKIRISNANKSLVKRFSRDIVKETIYNSNVDEFIDKKYAIKLLDTHLKGHRDNSRKIWTIFTFCLWHQLFIEHKMSSINTFSILIRGQKHAMFSPS